MPRTWVLGTRVRFPPAPPFFHFSTGPSRGPWRTLNGHPRVQDVDLGPRPGDRSREEGGRREGQAGRPGRPEEPLPPLARGAGEEEGGPRSPRRPLLRAPRPEARRAQEGTRVPRDRAPGRPRRAGAGCRCGRPAAPSTTGAVHGWPAGARAARGRDRGPPRPPRPPPRRAVARLPDLGGPVQAGRGPGRRPGLP